VIASVFLFYLFIYRSIQLESEKARLVLLKQSLVDERILLAKDRSVNGGGSISIETHQHFHSTTTPTPFSHHHHSQHQTTNTTAAIDKAPYISSVHSSPIRGGLAFSRSLNGGATGGQFSASSSPVRIPLTSARLINVPRAEDILKVENEYQRKDKERRLNADLDKYINHLQEVRVYKKKYIGLLRRVC
jgi:hypothetical protein